MMIDLETRREQVNELLSEHKRVRQQHLEERAALRECRQRRSILEQAQAYAQQIAQQIQTKAHDRIAGVVSRCLEAVFDEPYEFKLHFETKRGKTEAKLVFERNGQEVDPMTASGGGVVDVASFALRLSCLMLSRPPLRRFIVLDEPFRFVSEEYRDNLSELLQTLSEEMDVQILMITHIREMVSGTVLRV
jgi:DNA repair exonuclease SbcCD ATPase subunit